MSEGASPVAVGDDIGARSAALRPDGGTGGDPGARRHHVLRQLREQLELHPAVDAAWGTPPRAYAAVEARVDPTYFGPDADPASLTVVWQPAPTDTDRLQSSDGRTAFDATFRVHYSEPGGFDCGFHHEPNPHVDGWCHVQWRVAPDAPYEYEPASIESGTPVGALWEVLEEIEVMLRGR